MANSVVTNPIVIDTFVADVVLSTTPFTIKGFHFYSGTVTDHVSVVDGRGVEIIHLIANTGFIPVPVTLTKPPYSVDVSAGVHAAGAKLFVYV